MELKKFGISMPVDKVLAIDNAMKRANAVSRSDFMCKAVDAYLSILNAQDVNDYISPIIERTVRASMQITEQKISRTLFKYAVEQDIMMHIVSAAYNIDSRSIKELRGVCVEEVKRTNGRVILDDVVKKMNKL